jgi:hypothetical protein
MSAIHPAVPDATRGKLPRDADAAVRRLYWLHTTAGSRLHNALHALRQQLQDQHAGAF